VSDGTPGTPPTGGLRRALARAGAAVLAIVRTRLELATVEYEEERTRAATRLVLGAVAVAFLAFSVLLASALVVVLFWDTHRVLALAAVTLVHVAIGGYALLRLKADMRSSPAPFSATIAELKRDGEWLTDELHKRAGS
jgi:uncharacterized membrane protein YqjE